MSENCKKCDNTLEQSDNFCGTCGTAAQVVTKPLMGTKVDMQLKDIRYNLAQVYVKKGDFQKALEIFNKLLEENPGNHEIQIQINSINHLLEVPK